MSAEAENKTDLKNLSLAELSTYVKDLGEPAFRAKQIFSWLYRPFITSFEQMTDVAIAFRQRLNTMATISQLSLHQKEQSDDGTIKYAFELQDKSRLESVLIPDDDRFTLCVSSQVGCAMGCKFCLTGTMGIKRNLTPSEIVNQVYFVNNELAESGKGHVNNLVFMGMGEPLSNFDNLVASIAILTEQLGLNFSDRKITVSTCGIAPKIVELGKKTSVNLAISLHAADDKTRNKLMPVNKTYTIDAILDACKKFPLPKRRRIMIEYILIKDENDSKQDAKLLAKKLHGIPCKINLLPYNESDALPFQRPSQKKIEQFQQILWDAGLIVIIRESRGADISAACGQLANK